MKPSIRILVIANNQPWDSWPEKISQLQDWFAPLCNLSTEIMHTKYQDIPFTRYGFPSQPLMGVDKKWYNDHVSSLVFGEDIVLFSIPVRQWQLVGNQARGWRTDRHPSGAVELQVAADEQEKLIWGGEDVGGAWFNFSRHEIMHSLFMLTGQPDTTHYWWDKGPDQLINALKEIDIPSLRTAEKISLLRWLQLLLYKLIDLLKKKKAEEELPPKSKPEEPPEEPKKDLVTLWALAIQNHEDYVLPGERYKNGKIAPFGSLTWRNKNPGAFRFVGQYKATGKDGLGFAIFPTYEVGFAHLKQVLINAATGKSQIYKPTDTLYGFFARYAPVSDNNDPRRYAEVVAKKIGVSPNTMIRDLV